MGLNYFGALLVWASCLLQGKSARLLTSQAVHDAKPWAAPGFAMVQREARIGVKKGMRLAKDSGARPSVVYGVMTNGSPAYREKFLSQVETWAAGPAQQRRFFAVAGRGAAGAAPGAGLIIEESCPDDKSGLACKEERLIEEGYDRNAEWLVILGEDNYVDTERMEEALRKQAASPESTAPLVLGIVGCGQNFGYCPEVDDLGGLCGGGGYALNRAALEALMAQGKDSLRQEYLSQGNVPGDMASSCALRQRGVRFENLQGLLGNRIEKEAEFKQILVRRPVTVHYCTPNVMRWVSAFLKQEPEAEVSALEAAAFDGGCCCSWQEADARPTVFASVANRITAEQVFWQVGVRLPLAHFAGVHLQPRADREEEPKALKLYARRENSGLELVDMNYYASLSWAEIAFFRAVVLLPHNVHLVRTADLYALETILFVPSAPFIFQFIFPGSNLYGGHGAAPIIRLGLDRRSQRKLHRALRLAEAGYTLGEAPTAPEPGEVLPREVNRYCPYRFPALSTCNKMRANGVTLVEPCPWGAYDLEREMQTPLSCEDVAEAELSLRPVAAALCGGEGPAAAEPSEPAGAGGAGAGGRRVEEAGAGVPERGSVGLEVDPFDHLYGDFNPWCNLESYRYWYAHTEYSLLKGLQKFGSIAELLEGLSAVLLGPEAPERRRAVLEEMREHQRGRVQETVQWWAQAGSSQAVSLQMGSLMWSFSHLGLTAFVTSAIPKQVPFFRAIVP